jgi:HK97 family phage major capsid protein
MEMTELKSALEGYTAETKAAVAELSRKLAEEKREREDLELRISRQGISSAGKAGGDLETRALSEFLRTGSDVELKALSVGSDPDGGYMVLPVMGQTMVTKIRDQSALARVARRITIGAGDSYEEVVDFDESDATWVGETSARTATDTPKIGKISIPVHEIYALQSVTQRLLDDSAVNVGAWVEAKISDKFGRSEGTAFLTGDGAGKPRGLLTYENVTTSDATRDYGKVQYIKTGNATGFGATVATQADKLLEMVYSLRSPYKSGPNVGWMMNSTTAGIVRKFKTGATTDQYLWVPGLQDGGAPQLLGYPVFLDESMPDLGADTFPVAFGNFELAYFIVDKPGIRMLRDPFTSKPNVLFYSYRRVGGGLANSEAIKLLKCEA